MTDSRKGGLALIVGNVALLFTMALHPTGNQLVNAGIVVLNIAVHTLAIFACPILFLGAIALTRAIEDGRRVATAAVVFYTFALFAGVIAGAMSGYVVSDIFRRIGLAPDPQTAQFWRVMLRYSGILNQAFARILVIGGAAAIILWSCAMRMRALRWYGIVSNAAIIIAVLWGLPLDVHGYGLVVLLQGGWFLTVGVKMWHGSMAS
jgi:hypothetical protein